MLVNRACTSVPRGTPQIAFSVSFVPFSIESHGKASKRLQFNNFGTTRRRQERSRPLMSVITFVTGNQNKVRETAAILERQDKARSLHLVARKLELPELQGDPVDIAKEKCSIAAKIVEGPVVSDYI